LGRRCNGGQTAHLTQVVVKQVCSRSKPMMLARRMRPGE
jgi:hypothetical protein